MVELDNDRQVIIEIQVAHQDSLILPFGKEKLLKEAFKMMVLELKKFQSKKLIPK